MSDLLERGESLAQLAEWERVGGRLVFVGGEAGVGKTALVRAFAGGTAGRVLFGTCENLTTPSPLGPFVDIASQIGGQLARLLATDADPREVARSVLAHLDASTAVVLEDVHWADGATLDAIRVIGRRVDTSAGLVLATYRDDEVDGDHPLRAVLGELTSAPGVVRLSVPRLSLAAVRDLAQPHGADGDAVYHLTLGNAFYTTEVLAAGGETLPATVRDAVLARASTLTPEARRVLDVVAVVPARAELRLLEAVAGGEVAHLDECLAAGVLREDADAVAFRHELARLAVESAVPLARRRALHATILQALGSTSFGRADPARLAHHAEEAGDEAAVLEHAPAAARLAATRGAHREAAEQYARALRHAERLDQAEHAALLDAFASEAYLTGRYAETIGARLDAIEGFRAVGDRLAEGSAVGRLPMVYISLGRNAEAESAGRTAIELLESLPLGSELANAYAVQAYLRMLDRDNADGVAWGTKAVEAARTVGDREALSFGLSMTGTSHLMAGEIDRGVALLLASLEVAREEGSVFRVSSALGMLGTGLGEMYELERSEHYLREHIGYADEHDLMSWYGLSWLALVDVYRARWDAGARGAQRVLSEAPDAISRISALIALGRVRARRGDPGAADALDEALELSIPGGHLQRLGHVRAARAEAAWLAGDPERAVAEARAAYPLALDKRHLWFAGELAYWQWTAGALESWPDWIAEPYRLQLAGEPRRAAEVWEARGCSYEAARSLAETGDEQSLVEALGVLEHLGAQATRGVRERLRELGASVPRGPRATTQANPGGLTTRELDVLSLVAAGKRNAEIASELVVSTRTVDHHVSAILRKLGARTRGEATAAAAELGLLDPQALPSSERRVPGR